MYLVINKWVIAVKVSNFSGQYLRNRSTLDIGVLGYIGIVWPKEHSPEVRSFPPGTPVYTVCPRRNVPDFGRVFLMLKYTDITQNTYVQSWTVTEIMAREKCGLLAGPTTVPVSWQPYPCLSLSAVSNDGHVTSVLGIHVSGIVLGTLRTTLTWVRVFL